MPKTPSANYTAPNTNFPLANNFNDPLAKEDFFTLQRAVDEHEHSSTRGLPVRQVNVANAPGSPGQLQINGDDLRWWAAVALAIRTAAALENPNVWTGQQRFNAPMLMPAQTTPAAPGAGLSVLYPKADGLWYRRSGTGGEVPVGAMPGLAFTAGALRSQGTPGVWAEYRSLALAGTVEVMTFDGTATEQVDLSFPVPPSYAGTPITFWVEWATTATAGNAAFRADATVSGTGGNLTTPMSTVAAMATFAAQATSYRKNLSALPWTATVPAANDWVQARFFRVAGNVADTIDAVDVDVLGVTVSFG
jgi:hypothetical protein